MSAKSRYLLINPLKRPCKRSLRKLIIYHFCYIRYKIRFATYFPVNEYYSFFNTLTVCFLSHLFCLISIVEDIRLITLFIRRIAVIDNGKHHISAIFGRYIGHGSQQSVRKIFLTVFYPIDISDAYTVTAYIIVFCIVIKYFSISHAAKVLLCPLHSVGQSVYISIAIAKLCGESMQCNAMLSLVIVVVFLRLLVSEIIPPISTRAMLSGMLMPYS